MDHLRSANAARNYPDSSEPLRNSSGPRFGGDLAHRLKRRLLHFVLRLPVATRRLRSGTANAYLLAVILVSAATALRVAIGDALQGAYFMMLFPAIIATTLLAGLRAGALALVLATLFSWYFVIPPTFSFKIRDFTNVGASLTFIFVGSAITAAMGGIRLLLEYVSHLNQKLSTSNQTLSMVFECNPDAILLADRSGLITRANRRTAELFGKRGGGLVGAPLASLLPQRFRDRHAAHHATYMADPRPRGMGVGLDLFGLRDDGSEIPIDIQMAPVVIDGAMQAIATVRDLTEYKALQQALADSRAQRAVLEERQRGAEQMRVWADAFEHASIGILISDPKSGKPRAVNHAYAQACGVSPEEALRMHTADLTPPEDQPTASACIAEADRTGHATYESHHVRKDGSVFPVEIDVASIRDGDGHVIYRVKSARDITDRLETEREKERQRRDLERSNADLESFAYIASHDLKGPLRAISHLAEWIREDVEATASADTLGHIAVLLARVARLGKLLDALLAYSRVGRDQSDIEQINVEELVRDIVTVAPPQPGFDVVCEAGLPELHTHRTPLRVVLDNLIGNSLKHHDRATGHVTVAMRRADGVAEFRVSDDGPGIASRFHERIFEIFQTLVSRDKTESSGMGLAIAKKMVDVHGGRIWVESAPPERGASFCFTWQEAQR